MIEGSDTYREDDLFRGIGSWLRKLGWETQKTNHALRAYSGSQVYMRYEPYEAQRWLRHARIEITETHYSQYVMDFPPMDKEQIPASWATLAAPELKVLPSPVAVTAAAA